MQRKVFFLKVGKFDQKDHCCTKSLQCIPENDSSAIKTLTNNVEFHGSQVLNRKQDVLSSLQMKLFI